MEPKPYLSIGEFAKISGIPRKTLIFYDGIGLFSPEQVKPNGYRCYSWRQLDTVNVLYSLREIGVPLKEIKIYLDRRSPEALLEMFAEQKKRVDQEIKKLRRISRTMADRIALTRRGMEISALDVHLEHCEEELLFLSEPLLDAREETRWRGLLQLYNECALNEISAGYPVGAVISRESLLNERWHDYACYFIKTDQRNAPRALGVKAAGLYAVGYMLGDFDETVPLYEKLLRYIAENGLEIYGDAYEESLLDEVAVQNPSAYLSRISIQVAEK